MNKPILFDTKNVKALIDRKKTVTRRVIKIKHSDVYKMACVYGKWSETYADEVPDELIAWYAKEKAKPMYSVGDMLWVRETWAKNADFADKSLSVPDGFIYKASGEYHMGMKWRPSIFMPREAARIFLRVTDVRVERLQEITEEESIKEGSVKSVLFVTSHIAEEMARLNDAFGTFINGFQLIWESTVKKEDYFKNGWNANPYVWVYEFEICEKPEGWCEP